MELLEKLTSAIANMANLTANLTKPAIILAAIIGVLVIWILYELDTVIEFIKSLYGWLFGWL